MQAVPLKNIHKGLEAGKLDKFNDPKLAALKKSEGKQENFLELLAALGSSAGERPVELAQEKTSHLVLGELNNPESDLETSHGSILNFPKEKIVDGISGEHPEKLTETINRKSFFINNQGIDTGLHKNVDPVELTSRFLKDGSQDIPAPSGSGDTKEQIQLLSDEALKIAPLRSNLQNEGVQKRQAFTESFEDSDFKNIFIAPAHLTKNKKSGLEHQLLNHEELLQKQNPLVVADDAKMANRLYAQFGHDGDKLIKIKHQKNSDLFSKKLQTENNFDLLNLTQSEYAKPVMQARTTTKVNNVFDMHDINSSKSSEIIDQISSYVEKFQFQNRDQLKLSVTHNSLGKFEININKLKKNENIDIKIVTDNIQTQNFFSKHEAQLLKNLGENGVKIGGFKIVQNFDGIKSDSDGNSSDSFKNQNSQRHDSQREGRQDQSDRDARRRQALWETFKERYEA